MSVQIHELGFYLEIPDPTTSSHPDKIGRQLPVVINQKIRQISEQKAPIQLNMYRAMVGWIVPIEGKLRYLTIIAQRDDDSNEVCCAQGKYTVNGKRVAVNLSNEQIKEYLKLREEYKLRELPSNS